jgi:hypothetical protein
VIPKREHKEKKTPVKRLCNVFLTITIIIMLLAAVGCGGSPSTKPPSTSAQNLVDPSGNWKMNFTDSTNQTFLLSGLFSQTGAIVTGVNFSEVGNRSPFNCAVQRDIALSNGLVQNVNQFSGTLTGNFGTVTFTSTLNDAGTHAGGTYTITPGAAGNCLGIALTGTFTADEIPSMTGNWTGTVVCTANCPTGGTSGTISMSLTQDDSNGNVSGTFVITGLPGFSSGTVTDSSFDLLSGPSWQDSLMDQNGSIHVIVGGPLNSFGTAGLGTDRTFHGNFGDPTNTFYAVDMSH